MSPKGEPARQDFNNNNREIYKAERIQLKVSNLLLTTGSN